jgi:hypothetical protein
MTVYYEHDLIKMINLARILDYDPYYSAEENRDRVFFVDDLIPTVCWSTEMIHRWEAHGLIPSENSNFDPLTTRKYSIRNLQTFLEKHKFPLPGALFPDSENNTPRSYFNQLATKYFGTEQQELFEQKRHKNELLNKFFYNSEIVNREDYYQFETTPISQPGESYLARMAALKEIQGVYIELKHNKFNDELQIIQEWLDKHVSKKPYFAEWKLIKDLSEVDASIKEYESITPANITEIGIRDKALAELHGRKSCLQARAYTMKNAASAPQGRRIGPAEDEPAPVAVVQDAPVVEAAPAPAVADETDISGQEDQKRKHPSELLAMHKADPVTWTRRKLAETFCPLPKDAPFNSKKSWLHRELKKVTDQ